MKRQMRRARGEKRMRVQPMSKAPGRPNAIKVTRLQTAMTLRKVHRLRRIGEALRRIASERKKTGTKRRASKEFENGRVRKTSVAGELAKRRAASNKR